MPPGASELGYLPRADMQTRLAKRLAFETRRTVMAEILVREDPGRPAPRLRTGSSGRRRPVRGCTGPVGDDVGPTVPARPHHHRSGLPWLESVPPRTRSPRPVAPAPSSRRAADRLPTSLAKPRRGPTTDVARSARAGPRRTAPPTVAQECSAAWSRVPGPPRPRRPGDPFDDPASNLRHARRPARRLLATADRAPLAAPARSSSGRWAVAPDADAARRTPVSSTSSQPG